MRSTTVQQLMLAVIMTASLTASAYSENFNSRNGIPVQKVKTILQHTCWTFHHFDINQQGWNPRMEGDGAMVSDLRSLSSANAGIYTPLLEVKDQLNISFDYTFSEDFSVSSTRWIKICLADANNQIIQVLEQYQFNGYLAKQFKTYNTSFNNITPGVYRLVLLYGGKGENARIAIDELTTSAALKYNGGCNQPPIAAKQKISGNFDRTATGSLLNLNLNGNGTLKAFIVKASHDGHLELGEDGTFVFTPFSSFYGNSTSFTYRLCDDEGASLCSEEASVLITFPPSNLINHLVDFKGSYKYDGHVELAWNTGTDDINGKFEIERSINGRSWAKSGAIDAQQQVANGGLYTYIDHVGKNTALKKDIYYRLKHYQSDGSVFTSRLLIVRVYNTRSVTMISVTPNPQMRDIAVNVQLQGNSYVSMRVFNQAGASLIHKIVEAEHGTNNIIVDGTSNLIPGKYMLEVVVNSKERMLVKLIKE